MNKQKTVDPKEHLESYLSKLRTMERHAFARKAETSVGYLRNLIYLRDKKIGPELALQLEIASGGDLQADKLCPHFDWNAAARGRCSCAKRNV